MLPDGWHKPDGAKSSQRTFNQVGEKSPTTTLKEMELLTKRTTTGENVTFELIKEKYNRKTFWYWVKKNGVISLRIDPTNNPEICKIRKFCRGYGWMSAGELFTPFQKLTILDVYSLA